MTTSPAHLTQLLRREMYFLHQLNETPTLRENKIQELSLPTIIDPYMMEVDLTNTYAPLKELSLVLQLALPTNARLGLKLRQHLSREIEKLPPFGFTLQTFTLYRLQDLSYLPAWEFQLPSLAKTILDNRLPLAIYKKYINAP